MSRTLNMVDRLLAMGRNFQKLGRYQDAWHILSRLSRFRELPPPVVEETQVRLAELLLGRRKYRRARRHLAAALIQRPESARYHCLMARGLAADEKADPHRAADHYRQALEIDANQPRVLGELGLLLLRLGRTEEGLTCLRRGVRLAPDDPWQVERLAAALQETGGDDEARAILGAALFRNPRDSRFRRLWHDFQFHQLQQEQAARQADESGLQDGGPTLLPFVRPAQDGETLHVNGKQLYRDGPSRLPPPHLPERARLPGRRPA